MVARRVWLGLMMAGGLCSGLYAVAADEKDDGDLKKLAGKWTAPSGQAGDKVVYTFKGDKLKVDAPSRSYEMTLTLDPAAKPEKAIDFRIDDGPDDAKGKTCKGIYKFEGADKFVFCFRAEGDRPGKYEQIGFEQILTELTRTKD